MSIDPERNVTLTLPFGMIASLKSVVPILSMFRDQGDVKSVIDIIEAIYAGAVEFICEEDGDVLNYLIGKDDDMLFLDGEGSNGEDEDIEENN